MIIRKIRKEDGKYIIVTDFPTEEKETVLIVGDQEGEKEIRLQDVEVSKLVSILIDVISAHSRKKLENIAEFYRKQQD